MMIKEPGPRPSWQASSTERMMPKSVSIDAHSNKSKSTDQKFSVKKNSSYLPNVGINDIAHCSDVSKNKNLSKKIKSQPVENTSHVRKEYVSEFIPYYFLHDQFIHTFVFLL